LQAVKGLLVDTPVVKAQLDLLGLLDLLGQVALDSQAQLDLSVVQVLWQDS
jgi:hypothetical protein